MRLLWVWPVFLTAVALPVGLATLSPYLAYRKPIYITAGFAGIIGLALILAQPLLAAGVLPGLKRVQARRIHRWLGSALVLAVFIHVGGLWITSPPDVVDALTFRSPTPFAIWGVLAMWAVFGAATLAIYRRKLRIRTWRLAHSTLVSVAVIGTSLHAVLIEGAMETISKLALCALVLAATSWALFVLKPWTKGPPARPRPEPAKPGAP